MLQHWHLVTEWGSAEHGVSFEYIECNAASCGGNMYFSLQAAMHMLGGHWAHTCNQNKLILSQCCSTMCWQAWDKAPDTKREEIVRFLCKIISP
jgi:hypothetical protein